MQTTSDKAADGRSSIRPNKDGTGWIGRVSFGFDSEGRRIRKLRRGKTKAIVTAKVRELERQRDAGLIGATDAKLAVYGKAWLYSKSNLARNTRDQYEYALNCYIIPSLGNIKLTQLTPEQIEKMYSAMRLHVSPRTGEVLQPRTLQAVHRVLRMILSTALKRGYVVRNVACLVEDPYGSHQPDEIEPFDLEEVRAILRASANLSANGARWPIGMMIGGRQGEVLGLQWIDIDVSKKTMTIKQRLSRKGFDHGCAEPRECSGERPSKCPRAQRRPMFGQPKNKKERTVALTDNMLGLLKEQKRKQAAAKLAAGAKWMDNNLIFAMPDGSPIDHRRDAREWKSLLATAGVRDARLHDMRHTAATMMLLAGVEARIVMAQMGWSESRVADHYQHVVSDMMKVAAERVDDLVWRQVETVSQEELWN